MIKLIIIIILKPNLKQDLSQLNFFLRIKIMLFWLKIIQKKT
jgi:hypothetical protein